MGEKRLYSVTEVAEMTGRAGITIRRIAKRYTDKGMPIGKMIGNSWVFDDGDVETIRSLNRRGGRGQDLISQTEKKAKKGQVPLTEEKAKKGQEFWTEEKARQYRREVTLLKKANRKARKANKKNG